MNNPHKFIQQEKNKILGLEIIMSSHPDIKKIQEVLKIPA